MHQIFLGQPLVFVYLAKNASQIVFGKLDDHTHLASDPTVLFLLLQFLARPGGRSVAGKTSSFFCLLLKGSFMTSKYNNVASEDKFKTTH